MRFTNLDDNESIFFQRELEFIKTQVYDVQYPELKAKQFIPVSTEVPPGATSITYQQMDKLGKATIIASHATDLPSVKVAGAEFTSIVKTLGVSYSYSIMEIQSAMMAGKGLTNRLALAARYAIECLEDDIAVWGSLEAKLPGFLRNPYIPAALVATGVGGFTWALKTPDEILVDMNRSVTNIIDLTNGVETPDTMLLPDLQYAMIAMRPRSVTSDTTILNYFLNASPYIKNIYPWSKLNAIAPAIVGGGVTADVLVAYKRDPAVLALEIPLPFTQLAPQPKGLEFEVPCFSKIGGTIIRRPRAITILEGI